MVEAYVLIQAEPGPAGETVSKRASAIAGVVSADDVSGPFDVIAHVEATELDELLRGVVARIQALEGVIRTLPCTVVHLG
jgi:hypothetical protein